MGLYRFPPFEFDSGSGRLLKHSLRIKLQHKPQIVLAALLEVAGKTLSRQELYKRLWPEGTFVDFDQGLNVAVKKLRDALCDTRDKPIYVATVAGVGYRFVGSVERIDEKVPPVNAALRNPQPSFFPRRRPALAPSHRAALVAATGMVVLLALLFGFARSLPRLRATSTRSVIAVPTGWQLLTTQDIGGSIALSPDGTEAVYGARSSTSGPMLLHRKLDSLDAQPITGSDGGAMPFWSPDGRKIAFFADNELKTIDLKDHSVHVVCAVPESPRGGTWGADDTILFSGSTRGPILKVPAGGGQPVPVTDLSDSHYTTHRWPEFLPDGRHYLFLAANHDQTSPSRPALFLASVDGGAPRFLLESDSNAVFVAGQLLFVSGRKLLAQSLNPSTGEVGSAARILSDKVEYDGSLWHAAFAVTQQLLVFRERPEAPEAQVIDFLDESGKVVRTASHPGIFRGVSVSPDGRRVATLCGNPDMNICLIQPDGSTTRIIDSPINWLPAWSPDGHSLAYGTHRGSQRFSLVLKDSNGQNPEQELMESDSSLDARSWSPDQKELLVERNQGKGRTGLVVFRLGDRKWRSFLSGNFNIKTGRFSSDGRWVAYESDESGRGEIYITRYPAADVKYRISNAGGHAPRWSSDSHELYFLDSTDMIQRVRLAVTGPELKIQPPTPLFRPAILPPPYDSDSFDVAGLEQLFVVNRDTSQNSSGYVLVTSWR